MLTFISRPPAEKKVVVAGSDGGRVEIRTIIDRKARAVTLCLSDGARPVTIRVDYGNAGYVNTLITSGKGQTDGLRHVEYGKD